VTHFQSQLSIVNKLTKRSDFPWLFNNPASVPRFDLVRDFVKDEAFSQQDRTLRRYLNQALSIIDDFGLKQLPKNSGEHLLK
jgi:hypothetical protein